MRAVFTNAIMLAALGLGQHLAKPINARIRSKMLVFSAKHMPGRLAKIEAKIAALKSDVDALQQGKGADKAAELMKRIESLWNEELGVLAEAAKKEGTADAAKEFKATVDSYIAEIAKLDLQLSQAGVDVPLGAGGEGNMFRPVSPGLVAFKPEGKEVLDAYHKEHKGTLEKIRDDLWSGKIKGEETFYVPETGVKDLLLDSPNVPGLKLAEAKKPTVDKTTDAAAHETAAVAYAKDLGAKVGGPKGKTVAEIELMALRADIQVESGLRILDPLFGSEASTAFKSAGKKLWAEQGGDAAKEAAATKRYDALVAVRDAAMKDMLDVVRDPSLSLAARRAKLNSLLGKYERALGKSKIVDPAGIGFAEARAQIKALSTKSFDSMITADDNGNLTQGGKPIGTLRGLMEKIKTINNLYRKNGVAKEFVISISAPNKAGIPKEVKILAREPKNTEPAKKTPDKPVDPLAGDGVVVDIGVGLGSYARDAAGEHGELVGTEYGPSYTDPAMIRRDLTWEHTAPRIDADSVVILGDALQTLPMMFGAKSVKRLFINNINATMPRAELPTRAWRLG